ncbi:MAG: class III extradiol ring-cleavage dioxygenase [Holophaga sp.]|nr:class III extradiol ring-cleavage dioxygenase [Holophaga sp.]
MQNPLQPVLFVSHGAPTLALDGGAWAAALHAWAGGLDGVRAILMVSAHWESPGPVQVMAQAQPDTLHDFGGFPEALYQIHYPAPGDPALAGRVVAMLRAAGLEAEPDPDRPLDHGAWVPLRAAFPEARIPVVQVSLPLPRTPRQLFQLGRLLSPLRREGVLIMGSGGVVHNLRLLNWNGPGAPEDWAQGFETWVAGHLADPSGLFEAARQAPAYLKAVPTSEHFDPLFFALGAAGDSPVQTVFQGWQLGSLSLRTWAWA